MDKRAAAKWIAMQAPQDTPQDDQHGFVEVVELEGIMGIMGIMGDLTL